MKGARRLGVTARSRLPLAAGLACSLSLACRSDAPPPLAVQGTASPEVNATPATPNVPPRSEGPWFIDGVGAQAMALRARGNHAEALEVLARLQIDPTTQQGAQDAGALALMRADSLSQQGEHARAAADYASARAQPFMLPLDGSLRMLEAQAWLDAGAPGSPGKALAAIEGLELGEGVAAELYLVRADAALRSDQLEVAVAAYKKYLDHPQAARRAQARAKLARALGSTQDGTAQREAASLWARLVRDVPLSDYAKEGRAFLKDGGEALLKRGAKERRDAKRAETVAALKARLKRRQYKGVEKDAKSAAAARGLPLAIKCELEYLEGSAIFKQRDRARARPVFERAATTCAKANNVDLEVKTRYQAARGRYAQGQFKAAARAFESLATQKSQHSYADDAWIKAGESWESRGDAKSARRAYMQALSRHPNGDMRSEARRRAVLLAFGDAPAVALRTIEDMLAAKDLGGNERAKLLYFRARARMRLTPSSPAQDEQIKADLLASLDLRPVAYTALQSLSRLHELGPEAYAAGLAKLDAKGGPAPELATPGTYPQAEARAKLWSRLGFGERAWAELKGVGVTGWPAAQLLAQAGDYPGAQRRLANLGSNWRSAPPEPANRKHWELAHPRPFAEIIRAGEAKHKVPNAMTFAIMQTESRFDANVVSWAGARGLVQLMPATAKDLASRAGIKLGSGDLFEPSINLDLGMRYLGSLSARFGGGSGGAVLAAPSYNAGAGSVDKWLAKRGDWDLDLFIEAIPYDETRKYTQSVMGRWFAYRWLYAEGDARVPLLPLKTPKRAK